MRQAVTQQCHAYWDAARGARLVPEWRDIDPIAIRGIMGDTFVLRVDGARQFPVASAGERINGLFNLALPGRSFVSLWDIAHRAEIAELCANVCDEAGPGVLGLEVLSAGERAAPLEMLLLPLREKGRTHARILGSLAGHCPPATPSIAADRRFAFVSMRILHRSTAAAAPVPRLATRRGDRPGDAGSPAVLRHGHLTLYQGGRKHSGQPDPAA